MSETFIGIVLRQLDWPTVTVGLVAVIITLLLLDIRRGKGFPPGPTPLPIVGNVFGFNDRPEIVFRKWGRQYGQVCSFKLGSRWAVVIHGYDVVREALVSQAIDFADRPDFYSMELLTDGYRDIVFSPYSESWKLHRKLGLTALRHFATGSNLERLVSPSFVKMEEYLEGKGGKPMDPTLLITLTLYNIFSMMCYGVNYNLDDPGLLAYKKTWDEATDEIGMGLVADFFPLAKAFPTTGPRVIRKFSDKLNDVILPHFDRRKKSFDPEKINDVIDLMLEAQKKAMDNESDKLDSLTDVHLVQTIRNIFGAGIMTSRDTLLWALAIFAEYPDVQAKIQTEIDQVIGRDRLPTLNDRNHLPYTEASILELFRYTSVAPLGLPHATTRTTTFRGYTIPKGTMVVYNIWDMHYDPKQWKDPETFRPENFLDADGKVTYNPTHFMPFGAGKRNCLGEVVGRSIIFMILTWLLQKYALKKDPAQGDETLLRMKTGVQGRFPKPYEIVIVRRD
ncbi:cytochrome P450 1A5-like [Diadema antillarum]|uniref:cytochrome P450 1A5-like n=1 Tax=Diadema antillarum TaxID=105358 RepID=UPI003A897E48